MISNRTQDHPVNKQPGRLCCPEEWLPVPHLTIAAHPNPEGGRVAVIKHQGQTERPEQFVKALPLVWGLVPLRHCPHQFEGRPPVE